MYIEGVKSIFLGNCVCCNKDMYSLVDIQENPYNGSFIEIKNNFITVVGCYGSEVFDGNTGTIIDYELYKKILDNKDKKQYICDECLVKYKDTKIYWFIENTINYDEYSQEQFENYLHINFSKNTIKYLYKTIPQYALCLKVSDGIDNICNITNRILNFTMYNRFVKNENHLLLYTTDEHRPFKTYNSTTHMYIDNFIPDNKNLVKEISKDSVIVIYANFNDYEIIPEKEFYNRFAY